MTIRPRSEDDLPECVDALREVNVSDDYPHRWPVDPAAWLTPENTAAAWVAVHDGRIAGHIVLGDRGGALWVSRLFVPPGFRGLNVGESLLRHARTRGPLMLDVIENSSKAIELYERTGWTLVDRRPADWTFASGFRPMERVYRADPVAD